jgi:transcriptional regulator with XRE-family HTH domain
MLPSSYLDGWRSTAFAAGIASVALALQVGTGGQLTETYYKLRGEKGYAFARYETDISDAAAVTIRTPAEDLGRIRAVLKPTVTDLAGLFGVSRQAIYDWQAGKAIASENAAKLEDLAKAADVLAAEGLTTSYQLLRRKLPGGKTLFEVVRDGGSAESAARSLVQMVRRELEQRKAVEARLAGRSRAAPDAADYGVPMLDEGD